MILLAQFLKGKTSQVLCDVLGSGGSLGEGASGAVSMSASIRRRCCRRVCAVGRAGSAREGNRLAAAREFMSPEIDFQLAFQACLQRSAQCEPVDKQQLRRLIIALTEDDSIPVRRNRKSATVIIGGG